MSKQNLAILAGAIVLFAVAVIGAMAFSGGDSGTPMMRMPDGSTMPADQMTTDDDMTMEDGSTMPADQMTTDDDMTMEDGSTMDEDEMTTP